MVDPFRHQVNKIKQPWKWECSNKDCRKGNAYRFSIISGTVFENTKYPLRIWFEVVWQMLNSERGEARCRWLTSSLVSRYCERAPSRTRRRPSPILWPSLGRNVSFNKVLGFIGQMVQARNMNW